MAVPERMFEVPRLVVIQDDSDPTVLKVSFTGAYELDRGNAAHIEWYNRLVCGQATEVVITAHVAWAKKVHRRDAQGDVDAIVETKSLVVSDVFVGAPAA